MRNIAVALPLLAIIFLAPAVYAQDSQPPAAIVEKMAYKLARGLTNVVTCIAELPKQTIITTREQGKVGYVIGPLKGIMMTLYRGVVGGVEAAFFMVPQPGYYDPMIDPEYVWNGWEERRNDQTVKGEERAKP
jgi:putative exosortase-associated protein (TIGR04073 family)